MTTRSNPTRSSSYLSSTSHRPAAGSDAGSVRPRNRRLISTDDDSTPTATTNRNSGIFSALSPPSSRAASRNASPLPFGRTSAPSGDDGAGNIGQFLNESLTQGWNSVQGLASSLLSTTEGPSKGSRSSSRPAVWGRSSSAVRGNTSKTSASSWGPAPPPNNPGLDDVAAGSMADREAALKAAKRASVLQSHDGVNGGLDTSGKHKRRNSDDVAPSSAQQPEEYLVYIHKVQSSDTYAGIILRYRCREDAFRKANGLWSRDSVQTRKWLLIPVDACEIRGRPCDAPSWQNANSVDLLAPTPAPVEESAGQSAPHDDFFSQPVGGKQAPAGQGQEEDKPWTHVRWVKIDSLQEPVEIGRVPQQATGYFPPRRKRSIRTTSPISTPRQSLDMSSTAPASVDGRSSRRQSSLGSRPQWAGMGGSPLSRVGSEGGDSRPAWMRRPGGVGSMGRHVRAPGPEKDYFNSWTSKHIPGLNIEGPSMSIMGSETAHFGFGKESGNIVESSFEDGREVPSTSRQGTGLDKAAAAVETWLRGALSRRPSTPLLGGLAKTSNRNAGNDSIELADTGSDDGKYLAESATNLLSSMTIGSSSRNNGDGPVRGRPMASAYKGSKDD